MNKKILFIVNPISGIGKQKLVETLIKTKINPDLFDAEIRYTERRHHAAEISATFAGQYDIIVAVGGDGSVNEVSSGLINSSSKLGIIPAGSGNGFARFMKIPLNHENALDVILKGNSKRIDTGLMNNHHFINVSGLGFDAHISHRFASFGKRGFFSYIKLVTTEFKNYKPQQYTLTIDGNIIHSEAFLISIANSSQFGNNAHIAPKAKTDDGLLDITILKQFPLASAPVIAYKLFNKTLDNSKFTETYTGKEILITTKNPEIPAHIDGEPVMMNNELFFTIKPTCLQVVCP